MISKKEHLLAAFILVLWSVGVILLPALDTYGEQLFPVPVQELILHALVYGYLGLQIFVFVFAVYSLLWHRNKGKLSRKLITPSLLYVYAAIMLGVSTYMTVALWIN
jgi:lysylphosphatidylglycerol synthetase-like protein (DUF2156 family)